ncbi:hypothetical protein J6590_019575 [Homalodisca vitripennis]|nr:hypothetical protein J6590_019575 [Homalodisca vitripennis]
MKDKHRLRLRQSRALQKYKKCRKQVRSAQLAEESRVVSEGVTGCSGSGTLSNSAKWGNRVR